MKPIDVTKMVGAVERTVREAEREGKKTHVVQAMRVYDTDIDDAWEALTSKGRIPRWFLPIEGELRLGGRYQLKGNAGGTITACQPPRHFAATWEYANEVSWIEVRLDSLGPEQTRLTLEHIAHVDPPRWDQFGPGAVGVGWDLGLLGLGLYFDAGEAFDPREGQAWSEGDEGKRFARLASDDWCRASIAAGTDAAAARAAADRTTAAYTGT